MAKIKDHLFKVKRISAAVRSRYKNNLGWFFDDSAGNPLSFPTGLLDISADDAAGELKVAFVPSKISLDQINSYLLSLGIKAVAIGEYKPSMQARVMHVILYPFLFIIGCILIFVLHVNKILKGKKK